MVCGRLRRRDGMTLVFLAITMVVLLGMAALVIDLGRLYVAKQRAQNVADAASIGAAQLLTGKADCETAVLAEGNRVATSNDLTNWPLQDITVTVLPEGTSVPIADGQSVTVGAYQAVQVTCRVQTDYGFAPVLNAAYTQGRPLAVSIAMLGPLDTFTGETWPVLTSAMNIWVGGDPNNGLVQPLGTPDTLKITDPNDPDGFVGPGNFLACAFEGDSGANDFRMRLAGDASPVTIDVGGAINLNTEPGNMVGPTDQGVARLLDKEPAYSYQEWVDLGYPSTPRVVIVPIIEDPGGDLSGRKDLTVIGFAAYFIDSYADGGYVTGRFITAAQVGETLMFGGTELFPSQGTNLLSTPRIVNPPDRSAL